MTHVRLPRRVKQLLRRQGDMSMRHVRLAARWFIADHAQAVATTRYLLRTTK